MNFRPLAVLGAVVLLGACDRHKDEYVARQTMLDRRLAELQESADHLADRRRELERVETRFASLLAERGLDEKALPPAPPLAAATPTANAVALPEAGFFDGPDTARRRDLLLDTQARIKQLERVVGEVHNLDARKRELEWKVKYLESLARDGG